MRVVVEPVKSFVMSEVLMFVTVKSRIKIHYRADSQHSEYNATVIASQGEQQWLLVCMQADVLH